MAVPESSPSSGTTSTTQVSNEPALTDTFSVPDTVSRIGRTFCVEVSKIR